MKLYRNIFYLFSIVLLCANYSIKPSMQQVNLDAPMRINRGGNLDAPQKINRAVTVAPTTISSAEVDKFASTDLQYVTIINTDRNTINMAWIEELISNMAQKGIFLDIKDELNRNGITIAIMQSKAVQNAIASFEKTYRGNKAELRERFFQSIERGLDEISRKQTAGMRGRLAEGLDSPKSISQRQLDQMKLAREAQERVTQRSGSRRGVEEGPALMPKRLGWDSGMEQGSTLMPKRSEGVEEGPFLKAPSSSLLTNAQARDIIKNDIYKGRRLTSNNEAELQWIVSLVQQLRAGGVAINLNDPASLKSLSELILIMSTDTLKPEVERNGRQYNILVKGNIQQSIARKLETILNREQSNMGIEEGPFPIPKKSAMTEERSVSSSKVSTEKLDKIRSAREQAAERRAQRANLNKR